VLLASCAPILAPRAWVQPQGDGALVVLPGATHQPRSLKPKIFFLLVHRVMNDTCRAHAKRRPPGVSNFEQNWQRLLR
jgi:hypothetical protein